MTFRSPKLLKAAKDAPICFACARYNDGTIVAAHSNSQKHGKGMGIKASDAMVAYICSQCHDEIDKGKLPRQAKNEIWNDAYQNTMRWLIESGRLQYH